MVTRMSCYILSKRFCSRRNGLLSSLENVVVANVNKVVLELWIKVGEKMGVPFVTEGTTENNLKVTVGCSLSVKKETSAS